MELEGKVTPERILVVDDEKSMCDLLTEVLVNEGYYVRTAHSGQEAIEKVREDAFDLLILDLRMPDRHGLKVIPLLKEMSPDILVVIITAYASLETAISALRQGAYDYIAKPFNIDEIVLTVKRGLERQRLVKSNKELLRSLELVNRELEGHKKKLEERVVTTSQELEQAKNLARALSKI